LPDLGKLALRQIQRDIRRDRHGHVGDVMIDFTRTNQGLTLLARI
jgi:hypothetical protein